MFLSRRLKMGYCLIRAVEKDDAKDVDCQSLFLQVKLYSSFYPSPVYSDILCICIYIKVNGHMPRQETGPIQVCRILAKLSP